MLFLRMFKKLVDSIEAGSYDKKIYEIHELKDMYRPLLILRESIQKLSKSFQLDMSEFINYNYQISPHKNKLLLFQFGKQKVQFNKENLLVDDKNPNQVLEIINLIKHDNYSQKIENKKFTKEDSFWINLPYSISEYNIKIIPNNCSEEFLLNNSHTLFSSQYEEKLIQYYQLAYFPEDGINNDKKQIILQEWLKELFKN